MYFVFELPDLFLELGVLAAEFIYRGFELFVFFADCNDLSIDGCYVGEQFLVF